MKYEPTNQTTRYGIPPRTFDWKIPINPRDNTPQNSSSTATYLPFLKPDEYDMWDTAREVRTNS